MGVWEYGNEEPPTDNRQPSTAITVNDRQPSTANRQRLSVISQRKKMKSISVIVLLLVFVIFSHAQIKIFAEIIEMKTGKPVQAATVHVLNTDVSVLSNDCGLFQFRILPEGIVFCWRFLLLVLQRLKKNSGFHLRRTDSGYSYLLLRQCSWMPWWLPQKNRNQIFKTFRSVLPRFHPAMWMCTGSGQARI